MTQSLNGQRKYGARAVVLALTAVVLVGPLIALAAPLTYSSDTTLPLTAAPVTIKANSVADTVVVNAATLVVTMSSATGGNFVVTSGMNLTVTQTGAGTITQVCNSGPTSQVTITQSSGSSVFTITPTSSACTIPNTSGGGGSNSGGGGRGDGGGGGYVAPVTPITATTTISTSSTVSATSSRPTIPLSTSTTSSPPTPPSILSPQDQLKALMNQLQTLQAQTGQHQSSAPSSGSFVRDLSVGKHGDDVKTLQLLLINQNSGSVARALAKVGANGNFGPLTKKALIEFQKKNGIRPASGNFGPKTRAYVSSLGQ